MLKLTAISIAHPISTICIHSFSITITPTPQSLSPFPVIHCMNHSIPSTLETCSLHLPTSPPAHNGHRPSFTHFFLSTQTTYISPPAHNGHRPSFTHFFLSTQTTYICSLHLPTCTQWTSAVLHTLLPFNSSYLHLFSPSPHLHTMDIGHPSHSSSFQLKLPTSLLSISPPAHNGHRPSFTHFFLSTQATYICSLHLPTCTQWTSAILHTLLPFNSNYLHLFSPSPHLHTMDIGHPSHASSFQLKLPTSVLSISPPAHNGHRLSFTLFFLSTQTTYISSLHLPTCTQWTSAILHTLLPFNSSYLHLFSPSPHLHTMDIGHPSHASSFQLKLPTSVLSISPPAHNGHRPSFTCFFLSTHATYICSLHLPTCTQWTSAILHTLLPFNSNYLHLFSPSPHLHTMDIGHPSHTSSFQLKLPTSVLSISPPAHNGHRLSFTLFFLSTQTTYISSLHLPTCTQWTSAILHTLLPFNSSYHICSLHLPTCTQWTSAILHMLLPFNSNYLHLFSPSPHLHTMDIGHPSHASSFQLMLPTSVLSISPPAHNGHRPSFTLFFLSTQTTYICSLHLPTCTQWTSAILHTLLPFNSNYLHPFSPSPHLHTMDIGHPSHSSSFQLKLPTSVLSISPPAHNGHRPSFTHFFLSTQTTYICSLHLPTCTQWTSAILHTLLPFNSNYLHLFSPSPHLHTMDIGHPSHSSSFQLKLPTSVLSISPPAHNGHRPSFTHFFLSTQTTYIRSLHLPTCTQWTSAILQTLLPFNSNYLHLFSPSPHLHTMDIGHPSHTSSFQLKLPTSVLSISPPAHNGHRPSFTCFFLSTQTTYICSLHLPTCTQWTSAILHMLLPFNSCYLHLFSPSPHLHTMDIGHPSHSSSFQLKLPTSVISISPPAHNGHRPSFTHFFLSTQTTYIRSLHLPTCTQWTSAILHTLLPFNSNYLHLFSPSPHLHTMDIGHPSHTSSFQLKLPTSVLSISPPAHNGHRPSFTRFFLSTQTTYICSLHLPTCTQWTSAILHMLLPFNSCYLHLFSPSHHLHTMDIGHPSHTSSFQLKLPTSVLSISPPAHNGHRPSFTCFFLSTQTTYICSLHLPTCTQWTSAILHTLLPFNSNYLHLFSPSPHLHTMDIGHPSHASSFQLKLPTSVLSISPPAHNGHRPSFTLFFLSTQTTYICSLHLPTCTQWTSAILHTLLPFNSNYLHLFSPSPHLHTMDIGYPSHSSSFQLKLPTSVLSISPPAHNGHRPSFTHFFLSTQATYICSLHLPTCTQWTSAILHTLLSFNSNYLHLFSPSPHLHTMDIGHPSHTSSFQLKLPTSVLSISPPAHNGHRPSFTHFFLSTQTTYIRSLHLPTCTQWTSAILHMLLPFNSSYLHLFSPSPHLHTMDIGHPSHSSSFQLKLPTSVLSISPPAHNGHRPSFTHFFLSTQTTYIRSLHLPTCTQWTSAILHTLLPFNSNFLHLFSPSPHLHTMDISHPSHTSSFQLKLPTSVLSISPPAHNGHPPFFTRFFLSTQTTYICSLHLPTCTQWTSAILHTLLPFNSNYLHPFSPSPHLHTMDIGHPSHSSSFQLKLPTSVLPISPPAHNGHRPSFTHFFLSTQTTYICSLHLPTCTQWTSAILHTLLPFNSNYLHPFSPSPHLHTMDISYPSHASSFQLKLPTSVLPISPPAHNGHRPSFTHFFLSTQTTYICSLHLPTCTQWTSAILHTLLPFNSNYLHPFSPSPHLHTMDIGYPSHTSSFQLKLPTSVLSISPPAHNGHRPSFTHFFLSTQTTYICSLHLPPARNGHRPSFTHFFLSTQTTYIRSLHLPTCTQWTSAILHTLLPFNSNYLHLFSPSPHLHTMDIGHPSHTSSFQLKLPTSVLSISPPAHNGHRPSFTLFFLSTQTTYIRSLHLPTCTQWTSAILHTLLPFNSNYLHLFSLSHHLHTMDIGHPSLTSSFNSNYLHLFSPSPHLHTMDIGHPSHTSSFQLKLPTSVLSISPPAHNGHRLSFTHFFLSTQTTYICSLHLPTCTQWTSAILHTLLPFNSNYLHPFSPSLHLHTMDIGYPSHASSFQLKLPTFKSKPTPQSTNLSYHHTDRYANVFQDRNCTLLFQVSWYPGHFLYDCQNAWVSLAVLHFFTHFHCNRTVFFSFSHNANILMNGDT